MSTTMTAEISRLLEAADLDPAVERLVQGAVAGERALGQALDGATPDGIVTTVDPPTIGEVFLDSLTVEGFRGVAERVTLQLPPGPGLTLVIGPNGSGKSSLAEALEFLFTHDNYRWRDRPKVWSDGWRNVHHAGPVGLEAALFEEGSPTATRITARWDSGADLADAEVTVAQPDVASSRLDEHPWSALTTTFRPFLSYNELGGMLDDKPSALYDAVAGALGLDDVVEAKERLRQERLARSKRIKASELALVALKEALSESGDERASACLAAVKTKNWDLPAIESILAGDHQDGADGALDLLDAVASLTIPDGAALSDAAAGLRSAIAEARAVEGTDAGSARLRAYLLQRAIEHHADHGDEECPVCGVGTLDSAWRVAALMQVEGLRTEAGRADAAIEALSSADQIARRLLSPPPPAVGNVADLGLSTSIEAIWRQWADLDAVGDDPERLADHLDTNSRAFIEAVEATVQEAQEQRARLQDDWRPLVAAITEWLPGATQAVEDRDLVKSIDDAEKWLQAAVDQVRDDRFSPIADKVLENWSTLKMSSSVNLRAIRLEGASTRRRLEIDVAVDDTGASALGVMSQGELHALALCLFLPRATAEDSPFRFVVIDDPVQSMDPARVDGLARMLAAAAAERQVIVFTHDDRLPEAVRRLRLGANVIEVRRRLRSIVELQASDSPVRRYLSDARALVKTPEIPPSLLPRIVPTLCRDAVEAACLERFRRRRIGGGQNQSDVDSTWSSNPRLMSRLALALFDDSERHGEVLDAVEQRYGRPTVDALRLCNKGAHGELPTAIDVSSFVRPIEALADDLLASG